VRVDGPDTRKPGTTALNLAGQGLFLSWSATIAIREGAVLGSVLDGASSGSITVLADLERRWTESKEAVLVLLLLLAEGIAGSGLRNTSPVCCPRIACLRWVSTLAVALANIIESTRAAPTLPVAPAIVDPRPK
jgi:hypothetical protein